MVVRGSAVDRSGADLSELGTADRVAELRRRLASMPGGGLPAAARSVPGAAAFPSPGGAETSEGTGAFPEASGAPSDSAAAAVISAGRSAAPGDLPASPPLAVSVASAPPVVPTVPAVPGVPVPGSVAGLLPGGVLPAGRVTAVGGSATLRIGLLAAATAAGVRCAVVGWPELGVAAVAEQGGRLDCLALVPDPGPDAAAVVSVLIDGLDLVLLGPDVAAVAPSRARVIAGRVRAAGAVLLVGPGWPGAELTLAGRHCRYGGLGAGAGRLASVSTVVRCSGRAAPARTAEWVAAG
ncbi:hypothetical protein K3888_10250 [Dietzia aurantiaca]|nr:hypothetical protein [Dietzia aurantiaca]